MREPGYQALVCTHWGDWRDLSMRRVERVALRPGQVRIRVCHAGVGYAVRLFVSGKYQRKPPLPYTPGTEVSGVVIEVAEGAGHLRVGQRVMAALDWGAFAEEAVASATTVYPVPDGIALGSAAALPITYATAWAALEWRAGLRPGETLLVHGASGSLGMAAVQIGRHMGASVIATASTPEKRQAALAHGASHALGSDADRLAADVKALTGRQGVDVVFDPVGGDLFDASLRCVRPQARVLAIGFAAGRIPTVPVNLLLVKNIALIGFNYGLYIGWGLTDEREQHAMAVQGMVAKCTGAIAARAMPPPLTRHFAFTDWEEAIGTTMSRRSVGKVIIDIGGT